MQATGSSWTARRTSAVVAVVANIALATWWFATHPEAFAQVSNVVKVLWAAFLVFAATFGIKHKSKRQLVWAEVFGTPPVQALTWAFTAYTLGAVGVSVLSTVSVHEVLIVPPQSVENVPYHLRLRPGDAASRDSFDTRVSGRWSSRMQRGRYWAIHTFDDHASDSMGVEVGLFGGLVSPVIVILPRPKPLSGTIVLQVVPPDAQLTVRSASTADTVLRPGPQRPESLVVPPGRYWLLGRAPSFRPDSLSVIVASNVRVTAPVILSRDRAPGSGRRRTGWLIVDVRPAGSEILLEGVATGRRTPDSLALHAGTYTVEVRKRDTESLLDPFGHFARFDARVRADDRTTLAQEIPPGRLPHVRFHDPRGADARYFLVSAGGERELTNPERLGGIYLLPGKYTLIRRLSGGETRREFLVGTSMTVSFTEST